MNRGRFLVINSLLSQFFYGEKMTVYYEESNNIVRFYNKNRMVEIEKGKDLTEFLRKLYYKKIKLVGVMKMNRKDIEEILDEIGIPANLRRIYIFG